MDFQLSLQLSLLLSTTINYDHEDSHEITCIHMNAPPHPPPPRAFSAFNTRAELREARKVFNECLVFGRDWAFRQLLPRSVFKRPTRLNNTRARTYTRAGTQNIYGWKRTRTQTTTHTHADTRFQTPSPQTLDFSGKRKEKERGDGRGR